MAPNENSKFFQTEVPASYRFSEFDLNPSERTLTRNGEPIRLQPKAFDALIVFIQHGERLVTKRELIDVLWPSTHVTEANLTNIIVALRKALGYEAICTVSKHGYRLAIPVEREPGVARETYARFSRAKELTAHRSVDSVTAARDLLWICLAEDPTFAPAWAWLGRACWFRGKFGAQSGHDVELADASFQRAFAIDPDLAIAHQFYTPVEADLGHARRALARLRGRLERRPDEAETLVGLVQVLRFCGLLDCSVKNHARAVDLDPAVTTSVPHTLFLLGRYRETIDSYGGRAAYYLDAAAWAALGDTRHAAELLRERLARPGLSELMSGLMGSLFAVLERSADEASAQLDSVHVRYDPEVLV